ncbi:MAG: AAA family ATPase, partial [Calditrichaeota bacterium]|nr:AAA family ATPase [Calditrichota bacterium]
MYKIQSVHIRGFWKSKILKVSFRDDVNILHGKNGSGKTTFINILNAVLSVDLEALADLAFDSITITLVDGTKRKTIRVNSRQIPERSYIEYNYKVSQKHFKVY